MSRTLESMNSELVEMMKFSEQQVSDVKIMKDEWVLEKSELSRSLSELSSTLEKEMKEKEQTSLEVSDRIAVRCPHSGGIVFGTIGM